MSNSSKQPMVPAAREAMNKFKMEAASEVGVNLKQGYNGDLTSKQAGSVSGDGQLNAGSDQMPRQPANFHLSSLAADRSPSSH